MAFNPDKYLENIVAKTPTDDSFNVDKYLEKKVEDPSALKQDIKDTARGLAQGATLGFSDEIAGGLGALKDIALTDKQLSDFMSLYREKQQAEQEANKAASERSPYLYGAGELVGTIAPGIASGGAGLLAGAGKTGLKKLAAQAGALGATQAIGTSENTLENPEALATDAAMGSGLGAGLGLAGAGIGKGLKLAADTDVAQTIGKSFKFGRQGENLIGSKAKEKALTDIGASGKEVLEGFSNKLDDVTQLHKQVKAGLKSPVELHSEVQSIKESLAKLPQIPELQQQSNKITAILDAFKTDKGLSPQDALEMRELLGTVAYDKVLNPKIQGEARSAQKTISSALKEQLPELKQSDEQVSQLLKAKDLLGLGDDVKDLKKVIKLGKDLSGDTLSKLPAEEQLAALKQLSPETAEQISSKLLPSIEKKQLVDKINQFSTRLGSHTGLVERGLAATEATANIAGQALNKMPLDKAIATAAKAPSQALKIGAEKLKQSNNQVLQSLGDSLIQGIDSADMYKKNAALFAIMQNPTARELLGIGEKKQ